MARAILQRPAPFIGAQIGARHEEFVDEVAFGSHDLDAVVAGLAGQRSAIDEVGDLVAHPVRRKLARLEAIDGRTQRTRSHRKRVIGVTPGVQDLHADLAAGLVHGIGHDAMARHLARAGEFAGEGLGPTRAIRRDAAAHQQSRPAARTRREVSRQLGKVARAIFEPGVHRAHDDAIREAREPEIQRGKQVPVFHRRSVTS
jgi:hypothetical protein